MKNINNKVNTVIVVLGLISAFLVVATANNEKRINTLERQVNGMSIVLQEEIQQCVDFSIVTK